MTSRESRDVLVADDDPGIRELLRIALQRHDLSCETAQNGKRALEHLQSRDYALLLLDLMMPELDGYGVLRTMQSWELSPDTGPIVLVMTAFGDRGELPIVGDHVHALIRKPFDLPELVDLVARCVRIRRNQGKAVSLTDQPQ